MDRSNGGFGMDRWEFRKRFDSRHAVVMPVIHVLDIDQTIKNVEIANSGNCPGVFLINHDFGINEFLPIITAARQSYPDYWMGINFLAVTGLEAFPVIANLEKHGCQIDAYWADDARIDEVSPVGDQIEAAAILDIKRKLGWSGLYFGGTAFKKQRKVAPQNYGKSASIAREFMDVVTTSGVATGRAADTDKIRVFREACGDKPIALASGITPENVDAYAEDVDCLMVATGINAEDDFYNIDPARLCELMNRLKR